MVKLCRALIIVFTLGCVVGYGESAVAGAKEDVSVITNVDLSRFKCTNGYQEIEVYKRGDGIADCDDSSDEDAAGTGNHTLLYFIYMDKNTRRIFLKGTYVNSNSSYRGEFQVEIPACVNEYGWKILYADRSHIHLRCFENDEFRIMSVTRDGYDKHFYNFTLEGEVNDMLGFLTNTTTGKPVAYFKYKNASSTLMKVCSEEHTIVSNCPNLKFNHSRQPEYLIFSAKNNGTLFWLEKADKSRTTIVKYSINTTLASNIGPELKQANHLTKDAARNRLYVQILADDKLWIQSFNYNGEQSKKVKEIDEEEKKQFAVNNNILYMLSKNKRSISMCNTSRSDCEKLTSPLDLNIKVPLNKYELKDTIYVYDYQTNLEEAVHIVHSGSNRTNTLILYVIIGMLAITLLFVALAYVLGKKKGERTQSMDIHDDIISGTLRKKPAYCEESLLSKGNDTTEPAES